MKKVQVAVRKRCNFNLSTFSLFPKQLSNESSILALCHKTGQLLLKVIIFFLIINILNISLMFCSDFVDYDVIVEREIQK